MSTIEILTNILNTYPGLPDFVFVAVDSKYICMSNSYECRFDDGIVVSLDIKRDMTDGAYLKDFAHRIYQLYLRESKEYGMATK